MMSDIKRYSFSATYGLYGRGRSGGDFAEVDADARQTAESWGIPVVVFEQQFGRNMEPVAIWERSA